MGLIGTVSKMVFLSTPLAENDSQGRFRLQRSGGVAESEAATKSLGEDNPVYLNLNISLTT